MLFFLAHRPSNWPPTASHGMLELIMKITIVRHGQTNYNVLGLNNADPNIDVSLTPAGIAEAERIAEQLKDESFDALFVSELPRTKQTASYINKYHHLTPIEDARLNDINNGFEGKPVKDYHDKRDLSEDPFTFRGAKNAESSKDVYDRTQDFLGFLVAQPYQNVLIVTSRHNIRHFRNIIDGLDPRETIKNQVANVEVTVREIS